MKNINKLGIILSSFIVLVTMSSCEDFLDEKPESAISNEQFWTSNIDAEAGVAAIYDMMQKTYKEKHYYWGEQRADNWVIYPGNQGDNTQMITNTILAQSSELVQWDEIYRMISRANNAIENIPTIPNYNTNLLGEAYAARAYAYFDIYRVWGNAPIFTKFVSTSGAEAYVEQSSKEEVLALVISDLAQAQKLVTTPTSRFRFSVASLLVFKAKMLMHLNRYAEAKVVLDEFFTKNTSTFKFGFATNRDTWNKMFTMATEVGPELIFSLRSTLIEDGANSSQHQNLFNAGVPRAFISPALIKKWSDRFPITKAAWDVKYPGIAPPLGVTGLPVYGDWRYLESLQPATTYFYSPTRTFLDQVGGKYHKPSGNSTNDDTDIVVCRFADVVLLKALVENRLGNATEALKQLNLVRVARQLPLAKTTDYTNLEDYILDERQFELFAEGDRWWDLLRTQKASQVMFPINGQTDAKLLWPVWFVHMENNPKLKQTPGYN